MANDLQGAPQFVRYFGPVLESLQELGGSGRPDEVRTVIAQRLKRSEKEQSELLPSKVQPRFDNQVHWARFYLSKAGYVDSSKHGVWALTEKGRAIIPLSSADARSLFKSIHATVAKAKGKKPNDRKKENGIDALPPTGAELDYGEAVLSKLQNLA
jgi:restriction system protein